MSPPQFAVKNAPASVEVMIVNEVKARPPKLQIKGPVIEKRSVKSVQGFSSERGALTEANPDYLKNPAPVYPEYAREQGWEGLVILDVSVDQNGAVREVRVSQSSQYKILDSAAVKAVRRWTFLPARFGKISFSSRIKIPVRFVLTENNAHPTH